MIIYTKEINIDFINYGIEIPIFSSKYDKTFLKLKKYFHFKKKINQWYTKFSYEKITKDDLLRVHSKEYIDKLYSENLEKEIIKTYELIDEKGKYFRYKPEIATLDLSHLFERTLNNVSGTYQCCKEALIMGFCYFMGGGMHHAQKDYGNGFCLLNDIMISIRRIQFEKLVKNVWVIDVDAHKGDGTAALSYNDDSVITLSIHMGDSWPLDGKKYDSNGKLNLSFIPSNIDIPVYKGEDNLYYDKLKKGLVELEKYSKPGLILVVSGVDPYKYDKLKSSKNLQLTKRQIFERDKLVYNFIKKQNVPSAYLMAGGYGKQAWRLYLNCIKYILTNNLK